MHPPLMGAAEYMHATVGMCMLREMFHIKWQGMLQMYMGIGHVLVGLKVCTLRGLDGWLYKRLASGPRDCLLNRRDHQMRDEQMDTRQGCSHLPCMSVRKASSECTTTSVLSGVLRGLLRFSRITRPASITPCRQGTSGQHGLYDAKLNGLNNAS